MKANNKITYGVIAFCLLAVGYTIIAKAKQKVVMQDQALQAELDTIYSLIDNKVNEDGAGYANLQNVEPVAGYNGDELAERLYKILNSFVQDEAKALDILSNKTKRQLKTIELSLQRKYGLSLDEYLIRLFKNSFGVTDTEGLKRARAIINNAK